MVRFNWTAPPHPPTRGYRIAITQARIAADVRTTFYDARLSRGGVYTFHATPISGHYPSQSSSVTVTYLGEEHCICDQLLCITCAGTQVPSISVQTLTSTSVTISTTAARYSLPVLNYRATVSRRTGSGQLLCETITDEHPEKRSTQKDVSFDNLEEYSIYTMTVASEFSSLFGGKTTRSATGTFTTLTSGKCMHVLKALAN